MEKKRKRGRPRTGNKLGVYARIDAETVRALDALGKTMIGKPKRSALINEACAEFVKKHGGYGRSAEDG